MFHITVLDVVNSQEFNTMEYNNIFLCVSGYFSQSVMCGLQQLSSKFLHQICFGTVNFVTSIIPVKRFQIFILIFVQFAKRRTEFHLKLFHLFSKCFWYILRNLDNKS